MSEDWCYIILSEEAEVDQPQPQRILRRGDELEMSCRTSQQQNSMIQPEVQASESETRLKEELNELLGRWTELNNQAEARAAADLAAEETRLQELDEQKQEVAHYKNLLIKEKGVREEKDTHTRKLEEENKKMTAELARIKPLREKHVDEIKKLTRAMHNSQEKQDILNKLIEIISEKMDRLLSQKKKQNEENKNLKATVKELQDQLEEVNQQSWDKDELITKHSRKLAHDTMEVISILNAEMNISIGALKDQLEVKQEEDIPAGVENVREESRMAENAEHPDSPEEQRAESLLETPAAESQPGPSWRRYATGLGIAAVGVGLITWAFCSTR